MLDLGVCPFHPTPLGLSYLLLPWMFSWIDCNPHSNWYELPLMHLRQGTKLYHGSNRLSDIQLPSLPLRSAQRICHSPWQSVPRVYLLVQYRRQES